MKRWLRAFTALLALGLVAHMQIFFILIWRDGELMLHEPNRAVLAGEMVLYLVLAVYCVYRLVDIFRSRRSDFRMIRKGPQILTYRDDDGNIYRAHSDDGITWTKIE